MAVEKASGVSDMHCPDPSMHDKHNKLSEQASTAALYVTNPAARTERAATPMEDVLDKDGKLSSKGTSRVQNNLVATMLTHYKVPPLRSSMPNLRIFPASQV